MLNTKTFGIYLIEPGICLPCYSIVKTRKPPCEADRQNANLTGYEPKHREAQQK